MLLRLLVTISLPLAFHTALFFIMVLDVEEDTILEKSVLRELPNSSISSILVLQDFSSRSQRYLIINFIDSGGQKAY